MKKLLMILLLFAAIKVAGQTTGYLRFDTVRIMKQNGTCELYVINKTKDSLGLMINVGGGLTQFRRAKTLNDSTLIVGLDTLTIRGGIAGGAGSVTNVASGYGLSGGPITTTGTLLVDSATLSTYYLRRKDSVLYVTQTKLNDTATAIRSAIGTGGTTLRNDLGRLPVIKQNYPAQGISATGSTVTNYPITALDSNEYWLTTSNPFVAGTKYGGVLWATPVGDSMLVSAPFGVLIGSSFCEGHRNLHGRLDPHGVGTFDPTYPDSVGQMSYHLRQLTNMRWYNQAIGGQRSDQVRKRWARDALGQTLTADPDGRTVKTLSRKPLYIIYDGIGNDPYTAGMTPAISKANLEYFAKSCQDNGIQLIICNSPQGPSVSVAGNKYLAEVNKWLESGALDKYGTTIFDLRSYWSDPAWGYDGVHGNPNRVDPTDQTHFKNTSGGYDSLSYWIYTTCKIPKVTKVAFINKLAPTNPVTNYAYVDSLTISGIPYKLTKQSDTLTILDPLVTDSIWIKARSITTVAGAGTQYGYGHIDFLLDNNVPNDSFYTRRTQGSNGATSNDIYGSTLTILNNAYNDAGPTLRVLGASLDVTKLGFGVYPNGDGAHVIINGAGVNTQINNAFLSVHNTSAGQVSLGLDANIYANAGANHILGDMQLMRNGSASSLGSGWSVGNSISAFDWQMTPTAGRIQWHLRAYNNATTVGLSGTSGAITRIVKLDPGFGSAGNFNQQAFGIDYAPVINQTSSSFGTIPMTLMRIVPTLTSTTNVWLTGLHISNGNNRFNTLGDSLSIGYDSLHVFSRRFDVGVKSYFNDEVNIGNATDQGTQKFQLTGGSYINGQVNLLGVPTAVGTYTVLTHQSASDSSVTQVDLATLLAGLSVASGTYTPTLTNAVNIDASTLVKAHYTRVGSRVTVYVEVTIDPTATGTVDLGISLPVASNFSAGGQLVGLGNCTLIPAQTGTANSDAANDRAQFEFIATDTNSQAFFITFMYEII